MYGARSNPFEVTNVNALAPNWISAKRTYTLRTLFILVPFAAENGLMPQFQDIVCRRALRPI